MRNENLIVWNASDWCRRFNAQLGFHSQQGTSFASPNRKNSSFPLLVQVAPGFLPLPGLLGLQPTLPDGNRELALMYRGEVAAIISRQTSAHGESAVVFDQEKLDSLGAQEMVLDDAQVLTSPGDDPDWLFKPNDSWWLPRDRRNQLVLVRVDWERVSPTYLARPMWFLERDNCPIGALLRLIDDSNLRAPLDQSPPAEGYQARDIDVVAVTTDRYSSVRELLKSLRHFLPRELRVTIVAQTPSNRRWRRLASRFNARVLHVDYDSGLAWSRNVAVSSTDRPLVLLMDDDFQIDERCRLEDALAILNSRHEIAVLGGNLLDTHHWKEPKSAEVSQGFAMTMLSDPPDVVWRRLEDAPRDRRYVDPFDYFEYCDIVDNFALFRRSAVFDRVHWNPLLKIGAEHQDLYIRMKQLDIGRVARTNTLKVRNVRVQSSRFRKMRSRIDKYFSRFFTDLALRSFHILGERRRIVAQDGGHAFADRAHLHGVYVPAEESDR